MLNVYRLKLFANGVETYLVMGSSVEQDANGSIPFSRPSACSERLLGYLIKLGVNSWLVGWFMCLGVLSVIVIRRP